jgi:hypothetical protein
MSMSIGIAYDGSARAAKARTTQAPQALMQITALALVAFQQKCH